MKQLKEMKQNVVCESDPMSACKRDTSGINKIVLGLPITQKVKYSLD